MSHILSRRSLIRTATAAWLSAKRVTGAVPRRKRDEGANTPKIALQIGRSRVASGGFDAAGLRRTKQLGVDHVLMDGPKIPWQESELRSMIATCKEAGLTLGNLFLGGFPNATYGRPGRDKEIEDVIRSLQVAGLAGIPVVEYNFYAHRAVEGYYAEEGRAGSGYTAFDYGRVKDLLPNANEGVHSAEEMWANLTYFLKPVIPEAQKAGVRMALHPNDPPAPISRGSGQIMGSVEGWKRLIEIVDSPSNGITFDCGVTREMGHDPVEVCRYFGKRDRINHVHYRNVIVRKPNEQYSEVFIDEGDNDMLAIMKELIRSRYTRLMYPEHPRGLEADRDLAGFAPGYPGGGGYIGYAFNVGYTRAMLQSALSS